MIVATSDRADTHLIFVTSQNDPDNVVGRALNFMSHCMLLDEVVDFDDALKLAKKCNSNSGNVPIMMLIDLQLPEKDRTKFVEDLKVNQATKNIPVIGLANPYSWNKSMPCENVEFNKVVPMKRDPMDYKELSETITEYWFSNDFISLPI